MISVARMVALLILLVASPPRSDADQDLDLILEVDVHLLDHEVELAWGEDPFLKTPGFAMDQTPKRSLKLTSILYDEQNPLAVINGKGVSAHSIIEDYEVVTIGPNYVVLQSDSSLIELTLPAVNSRKLATLQETSPTDHKGSSTDHLPKKENPMKEDHP